jgi:creatinine amidohydrolase
VRRRPFTFGCSHEHDDFPGTVSISATTLHALVTDIAASLARQELRGLIIVNAHGGNAVLTNTVQQANRPRGGLAIGLYPSRDDWDEARTAAALTYSTHDDMHAGELETSILLAAYPDYLREGWDRADHTATDRRHLTTVGMHAYPYSGVIGYPSHATGDKGRLILDHLGSAAGTIIDLVAPQGP